MDKMFLLLVSCPFILFIILMGAGAGFYGDYSATGLMFSYCLIVVSIYAFRDYHYLNRKEEP